MEAPQSRLAGIETSGANVRAKHVHNAVTIGLPFLAMVGAAFNSPPPSLATAVVTAVFFLLGSIGILVGLHRYFSHRYFDCGLLLRTFLAVLATWAWQGPIVQWVADHRRHHRYADTPLDPHSPHFVNGEPASSTTRGFLHAHLTWMLAGDYTEPARYAADTLNDPISSFCSRYHWPLACAGMAMPALVGWLIGGAGEAASCLAWAGFARVVVLQHLTWLIGSFSHMVGSKAPNAKDEARDSLVLSLLMFGEGQHAFHHANPNAGLMEPSTLDVTGALLRLLERFGLIWDLKRR